MKKLKNNKPNSCQQLSISGRMFFLALLSVTLVNTSCKGSVGGGDGRLANLRYNKSGHPGASIDSNAAAKINMHEEMAVIKDIRKAWKLAAVKNDREGAMKILEKLDKEHPDISTVRMMMGQVEEHFGNHKAASVHFRKAHSVNEFSSLQTYKLAESLRKAGDPKGSIIYYEKLEKRLESAVYEFKREDSKTLLGSVRLGRAEAILDSGGKVSDVLSLLDKLKDFDEKTKSQAKRVIDKVLIKYPDNKDAKSLLMKFQR